MPNCLRIRVQVVSWQPTAHNPFPYPTPALLFTARQPPTDPQRLDRPANQLDAQTRDAGNQCKFFSPRTPPLWGIGGYRVGTAASLSKCRVLTASGQGEQLIQDRNWSNCLLAT